MNQNKINRILQQIREIYNDIALEFSQTRQHVWPGLERFSSLVKNGDYVLDLGCGNGRLSELFKNKRVDYLGIDNSAGLIAAAQKKFAGQDNFKFLIGDIINYSLPAEKFDLVLLVAVLHHLPTKELRLRVLKNATGALKPGGRILITTWNLWQKKYRHHLFDFPKKIFQYGIFGFHDALIPWRLSGETRWRYVHNFTIREIRLLLKAAGLTAVEIYYDTAGKKANFFGGENLIVLAKK